MYVPLGLNVRLVFDYLCGDSDARHTAKFSLFGGSTWARGAERFVHRDLLNILAPLVSQDSSYDAIIMSKSKWFFFSDVFPKTHYYGG